MNKEVQEIVGSGKVTGSVRKETIAVSDTIRISVQNRHSRILLRDLLRGRMRKMHREPEVLEAEAQVEECLDCRARITSKELAPLHFVKSGILQNACSTSQKMDADLGKSAYAHREDQKELSTCEFKSQDTTKLPCAIADSRTQFSWSVKTFFVRMLCLCLALMTPFPSVSHLLFPSL